MTNACIFSAIGRQLLIVDPTGRVRWHGMPLGWPVEEVVPLPGTARAVVLLDYMAAPTVQLENLVCVDCDGQVIWRARLPTTSSAEAYVSLELIGDRLVANTWSGQRVTLDPTTGQVQDSRFTK
jgi:hypothetical protein